MATAGLVTVVALVGMTWRVSGPGDTIVGDVAQPLVLAVNPVAARVTIATTEITVPVTTPALRGAAARRVPAATRSRPVTPERRAAAAKPDPLPRRIGRLIAGDGRYEVRPFPTVPAERP